MANVSITIITNDLLGNALAGKLRIEQPTLGESGSILIPRILETPTTGSVVVSVVAGASARYYFTPDLGNDIGYFIGTLTPATNGDFGTLVRTAAGQAIGSHTYRSIVGGFEASGAAPTKPVYFSIAVPIILKSGVVIVPVNKQVDGIAGSYSFSSPQTTDMYSPSGEIILARLTLDTLRVGFADMTIPAASPLKFTVTGTSVQLT